MAGKSQWFYSRENEYKDQEVFQKDLFSPSSLAQVIAEPSHI